MARTDQLHSLITGLDVNEKRYFKLNGAIQKRESNLMRLFDAIAAQRDYDEVKIRKLFDGEKFLNQLPVTKNHLFESILKCMRVYYTKRDIDAQISGMFQDIRFLFDKGMTEQCIQMVRKVKRVAKENERITPLLLVLDWESRLMADERYADCDEGDIERISDEYNETLGLLQNQREYIDLQAKIFNNYYKIGVERKNTNYKTNEQIVNQFALKDETRAQTFVARCCYLNIHALYRKINNDWAGAYEYRKKLLDLIEANFQDNGHLVPPERYYASVNNLIPVCIRVGKLDEAEQYIEMGRSLLDKYRHHLITEENRIRHGMNTLIAELTLAILRCNSQKGNEKITEALVLLDSFPETHHAYTRLHLSFNIAYFYFSDGQFNKAIRWLNNILNDNRIKANEDLHATCRILALMTHYELGKGDLLDYLSKSTSRYLAKLEGLYGFENEMLLFMKTYARSTRNNFDEKGELTKLAAGLAKVAYEPGERNALSVIDIPRWIQARLGRKPLIEIMV